ncbi:hypothetical protein [Halogeometricum borinquense]|uniref:hypothetical protein n=1 Tax=Halogeometricum borinquense TaxID=60847 RepID=UPI001375A542|nr:hypothetical protein [Halogeometricum borinquense]
MDNSDPERANPLAPYFPSDVPSLPTKGRQWIALLLLVLVFSGIAYSLARSFVAIF